MMQNGRTFPSDFEPDYQIASRLQRNFFHIRNVNIISRQLKLRFI